MRKSGSSEKEVGEFFLAQIVESPHGLLGHTRRITLEIARFLELQCQNAKTTDDSQGSVGDRHKIGFSQLVPVRVWMLAAAAHFLMPINEQIGLQLGIDEPIGIPVGEQACKVVKQGAARGILKIDHAQLVCGVDMEIPGMIVAVHQAEGLLLQTLAESSESALELGVGARRPNSHSLRMAQAMSRGNLEFPGNRISSVSLFQSEAGRLCPRIGGREFGEQRDRLLHQHFPL